MPDNPTPLSSEKQRPIVTLRERISHASALLSIACLSMSALIIAAMWLNAWTHNLYPRTTWTQSSRGPWSPDRVLVAAWFQALSFVVYAFVAGVISMLFKPNRRALLLLIGCILGAAIVMGHLSLIDD